MASHLAGTGQDASASASSSKPGGTAAEANGKRKWLPFEGEDKLPPAKYTEKSRDLVVNGMVVKRIEQKVKAGEERYEVTASGELIAWYKKRGGTGRKLVWQFKRSYADTPTGRERKAHDVGFKKVLVAAGIPGAAALNFR